MGKNLTSKVTNKIETLYTKYWAIAAHLELTRNVDKNGSGNAGRVNTLRQRYTNIGVTEKKEGGKGCYLQNTTRMVVWVKGLSAGTSQHARANQFQKTLL